MKARREFLLSGLALAAAGTLLGGCAGDEQAAKSPVVTLSDGSARIDNVAYARSVTGISIPGEAWNWWDGSTGRYARGNIPVPGAVLVFRQQQKLPAGHLAVVTKVLNPREIRISHADWASTWATRGRITGNVPVLDVSPANDWTRLRIWYGMSGTVERVYQSYGFVYGGNAPAAPPPEKAPGVEI
ncbi:MAG TPA: CHAP domain-containing protein [Dongiaceae bacterium]|jgi:hypothetical protein